MLRRVSLLAIFGLILLGTTAVAFARGVHADRGCRITPQEDDDPRSLTVIKVKRVITMTGKILEDAIIVVKDSRIEAVGENVEYPFGARVVDASDLVVMPGFINPVSRAARLPSGGGNAPHLEKAEDLTLTGKALANIANAGYTTLGLLAGGAPLPGRVLIIHTAGEKPHDLIMESKGPVQVSFNSPGSSKSAVKRAFANAKKEIEKVKKAKEEAAKKEAAAKKKPKPKPGPKPAPKPGPKPRPTPKPRPKPTPKPTPKSSGQEGMAPTKKKPASSKTVKISEKMQPLVDLLEKKKGALALVELGNNRESLLRAAPTAASMYVHWMDILKEYDHHHSYRFYNPVVARNNPFFVTAETNIEKVADEIGQRKALVALYPVINHHPFTRDKYNLGLLLLRRGAKLVYIPEGENWIYYARMRESLARMVKAGFPRSEILKTVTVHPAEMLGIADKVGTIEAGRLANLVFLTADPLDFKSKVAKVMIGGQFIEMKQRLR